MYLKSMEIQGFKSFAEKTLLSFLPPMDGRNSITAVVGPNGSGKSNISDGIRWVLGEQSMKQLRGKKGSDIIFSGSENKGQMSVASVTITLDNNNKQSLIEYDELVVTRKLYRTGDSEYLINGYKVRLFDLQILLAKAQFAHGSYSVIGQGVIDRMLLQSPQERKAFFDEASGIKEFQIKRHQAFLKLNRSKEHIEQADMILQEITPRLKTLTRQVKKLEQRQNVEMSLREFQEQYYITLWKHYVSDLSLVQKNYNEIENQCRELEVKLSGTQEDLAILARAESRQDAFLALQRSYQDLVQRKNKLEQERAVLSGRMQTEYSKAGKHNVNWLENKTTDLRSSSEHIKQNSSDLLLKKNQIEQTLTEEKKKKEVRDVEYTELKNHLVNLEQRFQEMKNDQTLWQFTGLTAVEAILSERHRFGRVHGAVAQLAEVEPKYSLALDVSAGSHLNSLVVDDDGIARDCIEYLRTERLGYASFLPLNKIKSRILPSDITQYLSYNGVYGLAIDLVKFDQKFANIFSYIFGSTLIIENINVGREIGIGRIRMVTLDGDILETSGSMKGGYRKKNKRGLSFADSSLYNSAVDADKTEKEMMEAKSQLLELERLIADKQKNIFDLTSQYEILSEKQNMLENQIRDAESERAALEQELALSTMSANDYSSIMKEVSAQKDSVDVGINKIKKDLLGIQKNIDEFNAKEEEKKQRVFALQNQMQDIQASLNMVVMEKNDLNIKIVKIETKEEDLEKEAYQELHSSIATLGDKIISKYTLTDLDELQIQIQKLKYQLSLIGGIDEEVFGEYEETKTRHEDLSVQLDDLNEAVDDLEQMIAELDEIMRKKRSKAFKEIRKEFKRYFAILFDGGSADLVEMYGEENDDQQSMGDEQASEDLEGEDDLTVEKKNKRKNSKEILQGIDIKACPPGKKIKHIQSLSGGERTMTSIALVCAILHINPAPFVVLDEVEAALDEANTLRLTKIIHELSVQSQFILITHNRATMHAADALYGVTMGSNGISKLVSVKLNN
ncbi:MAG: hypothetical protein COX81_00875 [Candidatus Magasanikbacteria bacterium CG_4_10_14_0_2_um_filter_37_12]|uniref:Chromosome partition protein Smc n=1 Tax=Candidatus Magasanikbacteria bacterium CG_4_10_14_0_2_um_filter_37_12 TaxID=1974637 RepID=A0A2M7V9A4_9BACT|nr:MAG: hypothetical protein COX81_00875 [Candidatus Magasanikbacteria bacterium CG_4_10_14_0_2_um_filter_37_12]